MKTILIVDDQLGIRLLLAELFQQEGYQTKLAENGRVALSRMGEGQVDCVLLDMKMPGMDGVEVLVKLISKCPELPVFMMTGFEDRELIEQALQVGAKRYFTKPFDVFEVRDAVNSLFARRLTSELANHD